MENKKIDASKKILKAKITISYENEFANFWIKANKFFDSPEGEKLLQAARKIKKGVDKVSR